MKIPIVRLIVYWDLAANEVLDDKLKGNDSDYAVEVLLSKDLTGNIYFGFIGIKFNPI